MAQSRASLPHFLIGGAQKSGTTWLARNVGRHPDVFLPSREIHFFDIDDHYARGLGWYASHFSEARTDQVLGEKTPDYLQMYRGQQHLHTAERIRQAAPDVKLLFVLRDPVKRALSALRHHIFLRRLPPKRDVTDLLFGRHQSEAERWNILTGGLYARNLEHYFRLFNGHQIRVWVFEEDIMRQAQSTLNDVFNFIGVHNQSLEDSPTAPANVGLKSRVAMIGNYNMPFLAPMWKSIDRVLPRSLRMEPSSECKQRLYDYYRFENENLFRLLGRRIEAWQP